MKQKFKELGLEISGDTAKAAEKFNDTLDTVKQALSGIAMKVAEAALPALQKLADALVALASHGEEIMAVLRVLGEIIVAVLAVKGVAAVAALGSALAILKAAFMRFLPVLAAVGGAAALDVGAEPDEHGQPEAGVRPAVDRLDDPLSGQPQHGAQGLDNGFVRHLVVPLGAGAEFRALGGLHDDLIAHFHRMSLGVKIIILASAPKADTDHFSQRISSNSTAKAPSTWLAPTL